MPGYNPNCDNCSKCFTCHGNGWVDSTESYERPDGSYDVRRIKAECRSCRGVGGKPMAGAHNHS